MQYYYLLSQHYISTMDLKFYSIISTKFDNIFLAVCSRMRILPAPFWKYIRFTAAVFVTTFAGAQTVHLIYQPLQDIPELIEKERALRANSKTAEETTSAD